MSAVIPQIEKLKGRENYSTWTFAVQAFLELEGLWTNISGDPDLTVADVQTNDTKAKSKIILLIDPVNYVHIKNAATAKAIWTKLKTVFEDTGLTRKVGLLRTLITTKLEDSESVDVYVNTILTTAHRLTDIGFEVSDEWIGTFLLAGLPDRYKPMIMGIESSGIAITGDCIKMKLLQDVKIEKISDDPGAAFHGRSGNFNSKSNSSDRKNVRCYGCGKQGHIRPDCPEKSVKREESGASSSNVKSHNSFQSCVGRTFYTSLGTSSTISANDWYIDSGASAHMTMHRNWLNNICKPPNRDIIVANNEHIPISGVGSLNLSVYTANNNVSNIEVTEVLHVPDLSTNLLSVSQMVRNGNSVLFNGDGCKIYDVRNDLIATASLKDNMYKLNVTEHQETMLMTTVSSDLDLWHRRLGHMNVDYMKKLQGMAEESSFSKLKFAGCENKTCIVCCKGKQTRLPFKNSGTRATEMLELVHSDLCGPMQVNSMAGSRYIFTLIDDFSHRVFAFFLKSKDQVKKAFEDFKSFVENQTDKRIKILRTDNGTEYVNQPLLDVLQKSGIQHQKTCPYTPEQNGVAERMNRTIVEKARCMLFDSNLGLHYWAEAVATAVYIINRSPTSAIRDKVPEEVWFGKKIDVSNFRIFGCKVMVHVPHQKRQKWDSKSEECIFVGYCPDTKGYRVYNPNKKRMYISRDVVFMESHGEKMVFDNNFNNDFLPFLDRKTTSSEDVNNDHPIHVEVGDVPADADLIIDPIVQNLINPVAVPIVQDDEVELIDENSSDDDFQSVDSDEVDEPEQVENVGVRRSSRTTSKPKKLEDYVLKTNVIDEPLSVEEALTGPNSNSWKEAMKEEFNSLIENNTWCLEELPDKRKSISSKWVFKTKVGPNGEVRYKARLVVRGCSQKKGIDYEETYSPVVRFSSIRYLIALAARYDLDIDQMDAVTAFLQGDLDENIYMNQPEGFMDGSNKVCCLKKAIYGLKQASRVWNKKLDSVLIGLGFKRSEVDQCIYFKIVGEKMLMIAVYVDDLLIFSNCKQLKDDLKINLQKQFKMKDLGEAKYCLGIQITRDRIHRKIWLDQERYMEEVLNKFNMSDCNPVSTPLDANIKLSKEMSPKNEEEFKEMSTVPYQQAIGSILYAAQATRPDICHAINVVSRYNNNPGKQHWTAVKRILRYIKGTSSAKIEFSGKCDPDLVGYSDADWASDVDGRRSITGFVFMLQGGPLNWSSRKQQTVALSTTEAEYMALSSATQEAMYLRNFAKEIGLEAVKATKIYCDNRSAICLSSSNGVHSRTKHIDIRHHYIRQKVGDKEIQFCPVGTDDMFADMMTKGLFTNKFMKCAEAIGIKF